MNEAILTRILKPNPNKRPSMSKLLEDEWIKQPKLNPLELKEAVLKIKAQISAEDSRSIIAGSRASIKGKGGDEMVKEKHENSFRDRKLFSIMRSSSQLNDKYNK